MLDHVRQTLRKAARFGAVTYDAARTAGLFEAIAPSALARFAARSVGRPRNPSSIITLHALNTPDKEALVQGARRFTYRQLDERIDRLASGLIGLGVRPGDRVGVMMRNCHEYLEGQWATTRASGFTVQIGYRLKPSEVAFILGNAEPRVLLVGPGELEVAREAAALASFAGRLVPIGPEFEALIDAADPKAPRPKRSDRDEDRGGVVIYTSGTTGKPKGASRTFKKVLHEPVCDFLRQIGIHHDDRHLVVSPL